MAAPANIPLPLDDDLVAWANTGKIEMAILAQILRNQHKQLHPTAATPPAATTTPPSTPTVIVADPTTK